MKSTHWVGSALVLLTITACDTGARKDLPNDAQILDESKATVVVNPDKFPNIAHKCLESTGFWTTTQGNVWIVYNDPLCPGSEGDPLIFSNIAGRAPTSETP